MAGFARRAALKAPLRRLRAAGGAEAAHAKEVLPKGLLLLLLFGVPMLVLPPSSIPAV